ncbi:hypothetical protein Tco_0766979 [Tanacetum coccineum]
MGGHEIDKSNDNRASSSSVVKMKGIDGDGLGVFPTRNDNSAENPESEIQTISNVLDSATGKHSDVGANSGIPNKEGLIFMGIRIKHLDVKLEDTLVVVVPKYLGEGYTMSTICVEYEWTPPRCSSCKVFCYVLNECPKKTVLGVLKNLKNSRQGVRGVQVDDPINAISDSEVDEVFNETAETYNEDSYNDDFDDCGLTDAQMKFADSFDISICGQLK